jgi:hypothetical protein
MSWTTGTKLYEKFKIYLQGFHLSDEAVGHLEQNVTMSV